MESLFDGYDDLEGANKDARLTTQLARIYDLMSDGVWRSLPEIADAVRCTETSASARLRDLRKSRFGGHIVERDMPEPGFYLYRLIPSPAGLISEPRNSEKAEARARLAAFLEAWDTWSGRDQIHAMQGAPLLASDIRRMMQ